MPSFSFIPFPKAISRGVIKHEISKISNKKYDVKKASDNNSYKTKKSGRNSTAATLSIIGGGGKRGLLGLSKAKKGAENKVCIQNNEKIEMVLAKAVERKNMEKRRKEEERKKAEK